MCPDPETDPIKLKSVLCGHIDLDLIKTGGLCSKSMCVTRIRWEKVATLEFDRNRKSMSVIACAPQSSSSTASGVTTRSAASRHSSQPSNVLFVKGAAEYMLSRCSKVCCTCNLRLWVTPAIYAYVSLLLVNLMQQIDIDPRCCT